MLHTRSATAADSAEPQANLELLCAARCADHPQCAGFYMRVDARGDFCHGLTGISGVAAAAGVSRSWSRVGWRSSAPVTGAGEPPPAAPSVSWLLSPHELEHYAIAFEGHAPLNPAGPWLAFTTAHDRSSRLFLLQHRPLAICMEQCSALAPCAGIFAWEDPEAAGDVHCAGLDGTGVRSGAETSLNAISLVRLGLPSVTPTTPAAPTLEGVEHAAAASSGGVAAATGSAVAVLVAAAAAVWHRRRRSRMASSALLVRDMSLDWDHNRQPSAAGLGAEAPEPRPVRALAEGSILRGGLVNPIGESDT